MVLSSSRKDWWEEMGLVDVGTDSSCRAELYASGAQTMCLTLADAHMDLAAKCVSGRSATFTEALKALLSSQPTSA